MNAGSPYRTTEVSRRNIATKSVAASLEITCSAPNCLQLI